MARKRPAGPLPAPGIVTPKDRAGDLPPLALAAPPRTPAEALDAASDYAAAHASTASDKTLVGSAFRAILAAYPDLGKAYVMERLSGVDRVGNYLAAVDPAAENHV